MFGTSKEKLLNTLRILRKERACCYGGSMSEELCDCKYSNGKLGAQWDEANGCPELRMSIKLIEAMTEDEFANLCKKAGII